MAAAHKTLHLGSATNHRYLGLHLVTNGVPNSTLKPGELREWFSGINDTGSGQPFREERNLQGADAAFGWWRFAELHMKSAA